MRGPAHGGACCVGVVVGVCGRRFGFGWLCPCLAGSGGPAFRARAVRHPFVVAWTDRPASRARAGRHPLLLFRGCRRPAARFPCSPPAVLCVRGCWPAAGGFPRSLVPPQSPPPQVVSSRRRCFFPLLSVHAGCWYWPGPPPRLVPVWCCAAHFPVRALCFALTARPFDVAGQSRLVRVLWVFCCSFSRARALLCPMHWGLSPAPAEEAWLWEDGDAGEPLLPEAEPALHRRVAVPGPQHPVSGGCCDEVPGVDVGRGVGRAQGYVSSVR